MDIDLLSDWECTVLTSNAYGILCTLHILTPQCQDQSVCVARDVSTRAMANEINRSNDPVFSILKQRHIGCNLPDFRVVKLYLYSKLHLFPGVAKRRQAIIPATDARLTDAYMCQSVWGSFCREKIIDDEISIGNWSIHVVALQEEPLTRYVKLKVAHAPGMPGAFSPSSTSKETGS